MTQPEAPKTRLQQLLDKIETDVATTPEDDLLDFRAGLYEELKSAANPAEVREIMTATIALLRQEEVDYVERILPASIAATVQLAERMMKSQNLPEDQAAGLLAKVSPVFGARPAQFTGIKVQTVAEIMERDLDLAALEKSFRRFGFDVSNGTIGAWQDPKPPAAPVPPPRIG